MSRGGRELHLDVTQNDNSETHPYTQKGRVLNKCYHQ